MKPKITVIMATYNVEEFIEECLESLVSQTYKNFIVKIIDDNSSDKTAEIIHDFSSRDSRIQLICKNNSNQGLTKNLNRLSKLVDTEYIARMDGDDVCLPKRFEKQYEFLEKHTDFAVVGSCAFDVDEFGNIIKNRIFPETNEQIKRSIIKYNPVLHPSVLVRTKDLLDIKGYDESYRFVQDYDLWFRILGDNKKIYNMRDQLLHYRVITTHHKKRNFSYRMIDAKIRWHGTKAIGCNVYSRCVSVMIPFTLGIMPVFLKKYLVRFSHGG
ncbi:glycosyltransferase [Shouchella sp. JSM 1781072]|uniref:glycosyltransferase n=1 Tax=Shouchella sp. JSM 1781072 TaxID=3344581 RepID=UPI0035BEC245